MRLVLLLIQAKSLLLSYNRDKKRAGLLVVVMGGLVLGLIVILWLLLMGVLHLQGRYRYGPRSRFVLAAEGPLAIGIALLAVRFLIPGLAPPVFFLVAVALALPLYLLVAVTTVELWRWSRLRAYDDAISSLRREEERCLEQLQDLERRIDRRRAASRHNPRSGLRRVEEEQTRWRQYLEEWQQGGGAPRVRALRLAEWREEWAGLDVAALKEKETVLERELKAVTGPEGDAGVDHVMVQLCLVRILIAERAGDGEPAAGHDEELGRLVARRDEVLKERERIRQEMERWQKKRREFLEGPIGLDG